MTHSPRPRGIIDKATFPDFEPECFSGQRLFVAFVIAAVVKEKILVHKPRLNSILNS